MSRVKALDTEYKGYKFRSRLEARWAVFFDSLGVEWEYEPEGFDLGGGLHYLPDFRLHGVTISHAFYKENCTIYVEVKGNMTAGDALKINRFYEMGISEENSFSETPVLVVGNIPEGTDIDEITDNIQRKAYRELDGVYPYNFETIDGDYLATYPGIDKDGVFTLFGDDYSYLCDMDRALTARAYNKARQARFEYGETPKVRRKHR